MIPTPDVWTWDDLQEGRSASIPFVIAEEQMDAFATLSGDYNPLHRDGAFAASKGFDGPVVYGALIVAQISRLIGMHLPGRDSTWTGLTVDFRSPLMVDEEAELEGKILSVSEAVRQLTISLKVTAAGRLIAKGSAEVLVR